MTLGTPTSGLTRRNGTASGDPKHTRVPLHGTLTDPTSLARELAKNPSDIACLLVELRRLGVDLLGGGLRVGPLLDTRSSLSSPRERLPNQRKKKAWEVLPEHKQFASEVTPFFSRRGDLLFVHVGARPDMSEGEILERLATFVKANSEASVIFLDWGGEFGHEHDHALVLVRDRKKFESALGSWATSEGVSSKARRWKRVTGWGPFLKTGATALLERHLGRCFAYAEAPPEDGHVRDLRRHVLAHGVFERPLRAFIRNATRTRARSVTPRTCEACEAPLPSGVTRRRRFCRGSKCRVRNHRRKQRAKIVWRVNLRKREPGQRRPFSGSESSSEVCRVEAEGERRFVEGPKAKHLGRRQVTPASRVRRR
jgi:hypothetical protein